MRIIFLSFVKLIILLHLFKLSYFFFHNSQKLTFHNIYPRKIKLMSDIHTDVGKTRALIRLALERKMLSNYLKELLADSDLLRYAF